MSRIVFLLEERSMKVLLEGLLPRLFPGLSFLCVPHEGRQDLEKSITRKLKAWKEPGVRFCVLRDNDGGDCRAVKEGLVERCREAGRDDTLVRIACQELEAWYFGDPRALAGVFGRADLLRIGERARFRDPDNLVQPARALASLVPEFQKVTGARRLGRALTPENRSRSFQVLLAGVQRLAEEMGTREG